MALDWLLVCEAAAANPAQGTTPTSIWAWLAPLIAAVVLGCVITYVCCTPSPTESAQPATVEHIDAEIVTRSICLVSPRTERVTMGYVTEEHIHVFHDAPRSLTASASPHPPPP
ncbi:unnamed protein product [Aphanomyces euteiches]|nr:hypothetical protein Ae201684P_000566 [Aphanomyces euteiches]